MPALAYPVRFVLPMFRCIAASFTNYFNNDIRDENVANTAISGMEDYRQKPSFSKELICHKIFIMNKNPLPYTRDRPISS